MATECNVVPRTTFQQLSGSYQTKLPLYLSASLSEWGPTILGINP
jgi:hypothetical protein